MESAGPCNCRSMRDKVEEITNFESLSKTNNRSSVEISRGRVEKILERLDPTLQLLTYSVTSGMNPGDNYMSLLYSVNVEARTKSWPWEQSQQTFLFKTIPIDEGKRKMLNDCLAFPKEIQMYTKVLPDLMTHFGIKLGIPTCYSAFSDGVSDYLAIEDMTLQG